MSKPFMAQPIPEPGAAAKPRRTLSPQSRLAALVFWAGAVVFLVSVAGGLLNELLTHHRLPGVGVEYTTELDQLTEKHGPVDSLSEVRMAARVDFDNEAGITRWLSSARAAGNSQEQLAALLALARLKPEDGQIRGELARVLIDQDRFAEAFQQARFAAWLAPNSSDAFLSLGAALLGMGRKPEAAAAFQRALQLAPNSLPARQGLQSSQQGD